MIEAERAVLFGVVDRPHQPGADRLGKLRVVDAVSAWRSVRARAVVVASARASASRRHPELAGGAVERRERELLGDALRPPLGSPQGRGLQGFWVFSGT